MAGTEMLSLGFVMLFFSDLKKPKSGLWLGLAFLTRYNWGLLIPLTLIQFDIKKIIKTGVLAGLTLVPWLLYNYFMTGNPIYSFSNFLMLNVILREATSPLALENFMLATLPTVLLLAWYVKSEVREKLGLNRPDIFMAAFTGLTSFFYLTASLRSIRYLHALVLPVAYFAEKVWTEIGFKNLLIAFLSVNLVFGGLWVLQVDLTSPERYEAASSSDYLGGCMTDSKDWPLMNYAGIPTDSASTPNVTEKRLNEGYRALRFKNNDYYEPSAPVLEETEYFRIYGYEDRCKPVEKADMSYLEGLEERTGSKYTLRGHIFQEFLKDKVEAII